MSHIVSVTSNPISPSDETPEGGTYWQLELKPMPDWLHNLPFVNERRRRILNQLHTALRTIPGLSSVSMITSNQPGLEFSVSFLTTPPSDELPEEICASVETMLVTHIYEAEAT